MNKLQYSIALHYVILFYKNINSRINHKHIYVESEKFGFLKKMSQSIFFQEKI